MIGTHHRNTKPENRTVIDYVYVHNSNVAPKDEVDGILVSNPIDFTGMTEVFLKVEENLQGGTIVYSLCDDTGTDIITLVKDSFVSVGITSARLKAIISGNAELDSWGIIMK